MVAQDEEERKRKAGDESKRLMKRPLQRSMTGVKTTRMVMMMMIAMTI
jgi:hypothetical protein